MIRTKANYLHMIDPNLSSRRPWQSAGGVGRRIVSVRETRLCGRQTATHSSRVPGELESDTSCLLPLLFARCGLRALWMASRGFVFPSRALAGTTASRPFELGDIARRTPPSAL